MTSMQAQCTMVNAFIVRLMYNKRRAGTDTQAPLFCSVYLLSP